VASQSGCLDLRRHRRRQFYQGHQKRTQQFLMHLDLGFDKCKTGIDSTSGHRGSRSRRSLRSSYKRGPRRGFDIGLKRQMGMFDLNLMKELAKE